MNRASGKQIGKPCRRAGLTSMCVMCEGRGALIFRLVLVVFFGSCYQGRVYYLKTSETEWVHGLVKVGPNILICTGGRITGREKGGFN